MGTSLLSLVDTWFEHREEACRCHAHSSLFKAAFERPQNAAALISCSVSRSLRARIDWETMDLLAGSFIGDDLFSRRSDLLFLVHARFNNILVYLVAEHDCRPDSAAPARMSRCMDRIWDHLERTASNWSRYPILPVVLWHAPEGWRSRLPTSPDLFPSTGDVNLTHIDLALIGDDELAKRPMGAFPKVALWLLRNGRDDRLVETMPAWVPLLHYLKPRWLAEVVEYFIEIVDDDPTFWPAFLASVHELAPETEKDIKAVLQQRLEEDAEDEEDE